jgi:hypothetical protein
VLSNTLHPCGLSQAWRSAISKRLEPAQIAEAAQIDPSRHLARSARFSLHWIERWQQMPRRLKSLQGEMLVLEAHPESFNFEFLRTHEDLLYRVSASAERYCVCDPNAALLKIRQFGEALAQHLVATFAVPTSAETTPADLLGALQRRGHVDHDIPSVLHAPPARGQ